MGVREGSAASAAGDFRGEGSAMFRKIAMILAAILLTLPIGGGVQYALARAEGANIAPLHLTANWLLGPSQLVMTCACLFVLTLAASRRWL